MTEREIDDMRTDLDRVRSLRQRPIAPPTEGLGDALDLLALHITYEHTHGSKIKAGELANVRDQLSALRARWGCR